MYWGNITASVDWCETNYENSKYIVEYFNTISSLSMVICGVYGYYMTQRNLLLYTSILLVGIGSIMFHATLLWQFQALDEVPMIYTCLIIIYMSSTFISKKILIPLLFLYGLVATYLVVGKENKYQFVLFHTCYGIPHGIIMVYLVIVYKSTRNVVVRLRLQEIFGWFALGVMCWFLDLLFCETFKAFQLHAWWHFFISITIYKFSRLL